MPGVRRQNQRRTMNLSRVFVLAGSLLACALHIHCTLGRGLSTPEERAKAIKIARLLERDPLAEDAPANRQWLLNWIIEIPDIRFKSCVGLLGPSLGNQYRYSIELNQQIIFSAAAFRLEHPDHLRNDTGAYIAGVEGALRVYEMLVKSVPDAKLAFLDDLVAKRDHGELADHVAKLANEKCKRPKTELILNLAGAGVGLLLGMFIAQWFGRRRIARGTSLGTVTPGNGSARITTGAPIITECAHRNRSTGGRGAVRMSGGGVQGFHSSPFSWRGSLSKHRHGGVAFVMELPAGCGVANNLPGNALHCFWNACNVLVDGRRCGDARIAAASFHFHIPIVAFDCRSQVGSSDRRRLTY